MWVFDGEEWTEEGASVRNAKQEPALPRYDELVPELQVIEQIPLTSTRINRVPPLPLP